MTVLEQNLKTTAHYLVSEANGYRSRDLVTVASGSGILLAGAVLGKITASGKYAPYAPAASDGSETAAAILYEGCDATDADVERMATRRDSEVVSELLVYSDGMSDANKLAALVDLETRGIIGR